MSGSAYTGNLYDKGKSEASMLMTPNSGMEIAPRGINVAITGAKGLSRGGGG